MLSVLPLGGPRRLAVLLLAAAAATMAAPGAAQTAPDAAERRAGYSDVEVKAAYLFHFASYAEWPPAVSQEVIEIAILRDQDVAEELHRFARDRTIRGRPVQVRSITSLTELDGAHVLLIGHSGNRRLPQLVADVRSPTLVVTDAPDGLQDGSMINFQTVDRRVRFEIALPAVQRAGLTLSSRLLSAALRVEMSRCFQECGIEPVTEDEVRLARLLPAAGAPVPLTAFRTPS